MKLAVICAVYNEELLLPRFLDYYSPQVDQIFLLDNESTDGGRSIAGRYSNVAISTYSSGGKFNDGALSLAYDKKRRECAAEYDFVILADCDEFIVPKGGLSIRDAIQRVLLDESDGTHREFFWTHGFNMWAAPGDSPYDHGRPPWAQRHSGIESEVYSKPCVIRPGSSLQYVHGRHNFVGKDSWKASAIRSAPFYLLHYIGIDEEFFVKRSMDRTARFSEDNVRLKTSSQYAGKVEADYRGLFKASSVDPKLAPVPCDWGAISKHVARRRLDVGSGKTPTAGYDTVDKDQTLKPTYSFDLTSPNWPVPDGIYDEVLLIHVLEHIALTKVGLVLRRVLKTMKPGGILRIHVPNGPLIARTYLNHPREIFKLQMAIYGAEAETDPAFAHKVLYDFYTLRTTLISAGFGEVEDVTEHYEDHHDPHWAWMGGRLSLKLRAKKPTPA